MTDEARVLVVANETLVGQELVDAVTRRAERGPIRVAVVAPVNEPEPPGSMASGAPSSREGWGAG